MTPTTGEIVDGKITGLTPFGAFVDIGGGKTGLIHISEAASRFVKDIHDVFSEGNSVKVKILSVGEDGKIALSAKQAEEKPAPKQNVSRPQKEVFPEDSFEAKMLKFKQSSEERLHDIKKNIEGKQRQGRRR